MNRVRLAFTGLMHRLGFVPTEALDAAERRNGVLLGRNANLERRLDEAGHHIDYLRSELDEVYALRVDLSGVFSIDAMSHMDPVATVPVVELRLQPLRSSWRFMPSDIHLMRAKPLEYARVWSGTFIEQLRPKIEQALTDCLRRI